VSAPDALRIARIMARDGVDEAAARARIAAQIPLEAKVEAADYVIHNDGSPERTHAQADRVLDAIAQSLGLSPERYALC
jgi:dephospho-CoA kinase